MNAQQTKYAEITLAAAMLMLLVALFLLPQQAFATDGEGAAKAGEETAGQALGPDGEDDGAKSADAQKAPKLDESEQTADEQAQSGPSASQVITAEPATPADGTSSDSTGGDPANESAASIGQESPDPSTEGADEGADSSAATSGDGVQEKARQTNAAEVEAQTPSATYATSATVTKATTAAKADAKTTTPVRTSTAKVGLSYRTHVQNIGWQDWVTSGKTAGTSGKSLRLEGLYIKLTGMGTNKGSIKYTTHVQNIGWQKTVTGGKMAGTSGKSLRLEGVKIWLSGDISKHFDVYYRTHVQNIGWQKWVKNGSLSGTTGRSLRLEALQIRLSAKTEEAAGKGAGTVGVRYDARVQKKGWQFWTGDGKTAGTIGKSLRVEAMNIVLSPGSYKGGISYTAHVQNIGWQKAKVNGKTAGTIGKSLRIEALKINLTGDIASKYDVYYRTHVQDYGWLDWAKNGAESGSHGLSLRVEAVEVLLKKKGEKAPGGTKYTTANSLVRTLDGIDISSWQSDLNVAAISADFVIVKTTGGVGYTNPYWKGQARATVNSGKLLGLYHYAQEIGCKGTAIQEADYFVKAVKSEGYVGKAILVLDWEADALELGPGWAKTFLDRVYSQTGVKPLIYTSKSVTRYYNWSSVAGTYKLWVAQYPNYERTGYQTDPWTDTYGYGAWSAPTMFQYTSSGDLPGYGGNLDLNLFYGNQVTWRSLAAKS